MLVDRFETVVQSQYPVPYVAVFRNTLQALPFGSPIRETELIEGEQSSPGRISYKQEQIQHGRTTNH